MEEKTDKEIARWYDSLAQSYDELYGPEQSHKYEILIDRMGRSRFKLSVDIGCGTGALLQSLGQRSQHSVGFDLSIAMLKVASKRKSERTDLVLATIQNLPIRDNCADCIVSISAIQGNSGLTQRISELKRIRQDSSFLAVSIFNERDREMRQLLPDPFQIATVSNRESIYFFRGTNSQELRPSNFLR